MSEKSVHSTVVSRLVVVLLIGLCCNSLQASVQVGGNVASDTTWTNDDTILVVGSVHVMASGHLTIQPGTTVRFYPKKSISVTGELHAQGERNSRIVFTSTADTVGGNPALDSLIWGSIKALGGSILHLRYCDIRYGGKNVNAERASSVTLYGCVIENFASTGFYAYGTDMASAMTVTIDSCAFRQSDPALLRLRDGIYVRGLVDATITNTQVYGCGNGILIYADHEFPPHFTIANCEVFDNGYFGFTIDHG